MPTRQDRRSSWCLALIAGLFCASVPPPVASAADALPANAASLPSGPLARVRDAAVTAADLDPALRSDLAALDDSYQRQVKQLDARYRTTRDDAVRAAVDRSVDDRLLALEAKDRHTTIDKLLASLKIEPVTDDEVLRTYAAHRAEINRPYAEIEKPLRAQLAEEHASTARNAYLHLLRQKYQPEMLYAPLRFEVAPTGPARGADDAPVTLVVFADFECPYCAKLVPSLDRIRTEYGQKVRVVYRHLPLSDIHANAYGAALASECAARQGKFWEMFDELFARPGALAPDLLRETATKDGVDPALYDTCLKSDSAKQSIQADVNAAEELGLSGTPATFINGRLVRGSSTYATFATIIDDELARQRRATE